MAQLRALPIDGFLAKSVGEHCSTDEATALATKYIESGKTDREAFDRLISGNLPLVAKIAKFYALKFVDPTAAMDDLMQEGTLGLMMAADRFDPALGTRFSTYACWYIRMKTREYSVHNRWTIQLGLGAFERYHNGKMPDKCRQRLTPILTATGNIDALAEWLPGGDENEYEKIDFVQWTDELLRILTPQQREIFLLRVDDDMVLKEIAKRYNLTRERIRQIYAAACQRLFAQMLRTKTGTELCLTFLDGCERRGFVWDVEHFNFRRIDSPKQVRRTKTYRSRETVAKERLQEKAAKKGVESDRDAERTVRCKTRSA